MGGASSGSLAQPPSATDWCVPNRRKPGGDSDVDEIDSNQKNANERRLAGSQLARPAEAEPEDRAKCSANQKLIKQLFFAELKGIVRPELEHRLLSYVPLTFYFLTFFPLFNLKFEL